MGISDFNYEIVFLKLENNCTLRLLSKKQGTVLVQKISGYFIWDHLSIFHEKYNAQFENGLLEEVDISYVNNNLSKIEDIKLFNPKDAVNLFFSMEHINRNDYSYPKYCKLTNFFKEYFPNWEGGFSDADFYIKNNLI